MSSERPVVSDTRAAAQPPVPPTARPPGTPGGRVHTLQPARGHDGRQAARITRVGLADRPPPDAQGLDRMARAGEEFFTSDGLLAVSEGMVAVADVADARIDFIRTAGAAYRRGYETVSAVSFVSVSDPDDPVRTVRCGPMADPGYSRLETTFALVVGYTSIRPRAAGGRQLGQQFLATLFRLAVGSDGRMVVGTPVATRDLAWAADASPVGQPFSFPAETCLVASSMVLGMNLVEELWRAGSALRATDWWCRDRDPTLSAGPLLAGRISSRQNDEDGTPVVSMALPLGSMPSEPEDSERYLYFCHLGPFSARRGGRPYVGYFPWAVVPGNVASGLLVAGDVRLCGRSE